MVADDMACCELLHQHCSSLLEILGWLIDVNLAIVYVPTNFFIKKNRTEKNSKKYCHFLRSTSDI